MTCGIPLRSLPGKKRKVIQAVRLSPKGAITIDDGINGIPEIEVDKCIGCGICVAKCPGLAIMMADGSQGDKIHFTIPYELYF